MSASDKEPIIERSPRGEHREITFHALQIRIQQQECLAELGVIALRGATLETLLSEAVRLTAEGLHTDFCKILEHHPSEHRFLIRAGVGWGEGIVGVATVGDDLESPAGYALHTKKPVISNHLELEDRFRTPEILQRFGIRRAMNVILQGDGRPYGVLEVDSKSEDEFEKADLAFLQGVANVLGMAIERQRHETNLTHALERHKYLLQEMNHRVKNSLALVSSMLTLQSGRSPDPVLKDQFNQAVHRIAAIAKSHELLYHGSEVEWLDLGKYIETICNDLNASIPGCDIHVEVDYEIQVATDQAIAAAMIVNELITNAAKYAYPTGAGDIHVTLLCAAKSGYSITVRDEGIGLPFGFDPRKSRGLGMRLVTALVQQLKGTLDIRTCYPGTEFVVNVPKSDRLAQRQAPSADFSAQ